MPQERIDDDRGRSGRKRSGDYRNVSTEDFRAVCERVYGKSLEWFFAQWVYGVSRPTYRVSWAAAGDRLSLTIRQVQADAAAFTMPIDVLVRTASGAKRHTVWNDRSEQTFEIPLGDAAAIETVAIDPDDWILKHVTHGPSPGGSL